MATSVDSSQSQNVLPKNFECEKREFHYLDAPHGFVSGMARGNLVYQMHYSVRLLEKKLAEEGHPQVLQLNVFGSGEGGWMDPARGYLYVDGIEVAMGLASSLARASRIPRKSFWEYVAKR